MRGYWAAFRFVVIAVTNKLLWPKSPDFDKQYGTVTNDWVEVADGEIPPGAFDTAVRYVPTTSEVVRHICRKLPIDHEQFTFVDLGSGRGRAVLLASDFPFKQIVGVEISAKHHAIAQNNVAIYRSARQRCRNIQLVCQNVLDFEFPSDNLVLYLYQPFSSSVLRPVLEHVQAAVGDGHEVFLCYSAPYQHQDVLVESAYLTPLDHFPSFSGEDSWNLYGNAKAAASWDVQGGARRLTSLPKRWWG